MPRSPGRARIASRAAFALVTLGAVATPFALFGVIEPDTGIGYATFRTGYALAPDEASFLAEYGAALSAFNGGYVPHEIDVFLAERWAGGPPDEQHAVIQFHIDRGWGRTGSAYARLGPAAIPPVLRYLETTRDRDTQRLCLGFLEGARRGQGFGKGGYGGELALDEVEARFRAWWALAEPWAHKREIDPLESEGECWGEL